MRNAVGACRACNIRYEQDQEFIWFVKDWYIRKFGKNQLDELVRKSNELRKFVAIDYRDFAKKYRILYNNLKECRLE